MKKIELEKIGFYTLSNNRAMGATDKTPLKRCELILTDACNFKCPYCRGIRDDFSGTMPFEQASETVRLWCEDGLENIRFSGGEPTIYKRLLELVSQAKDGGVKNIAISSNGSADWSLYQRLIDCGANDFSISLDGGCCAVGDAMAGGLPGSWDKVVGNIKKLSSKVYVSIGMVFTEDNVEKCVESVLFADSLGVSDVRVIPSAQYNKALSQLRNLPASVLGKYPILKYRIDNILAGYHVRGIERHGQTECWLALDDMAVLKGHHFPCIIHLREGGDPIGKVGPNMRKERMDWIRSHNPSTDPICKKNCLDVCQDYNECASRTHKFTKDGMVVAYD
ncbi:MAG: radical SAM protein [Planctomycetota bacterium]|jgi:molybdenum cofactor biosynthesis enzyme MoaA